MKIAVMVKEVPDSAADRAGLVDRGLRARAAACARRLGRIEADGNTPEQIVEFLGARKLL